MAFDKEQEELLWEKYNSDRSIENRNDLVMFYSSYVKITIGKLVSRYNKYLDYDDLISYGMLGLIDAIDKFDSEKGVKFETYASIRIKGGIIDQLRRQDWLPASMRKRIKKVEAAYDEIENRQGRMATDSEVCEYLGIDKQELKSLVDTSHMANVMTFDEVILGNVQFATESIDTNPEYSLEENVIKKALVDAVDGLTEKERLVVSMYYYDELTLKEIGAVMGVSESRVSQIHSKILEKLKLQLANIMIG